MQLGLRLQSYMSSTTWTVMTDASTKQNLHVYNYVLFYISLKYMTSSHI